MNSLTPPSSRIGFSAGSDPFFSYSEVRFRVAILLASTSGWLNALIPMIDPATAVAISQRKNSCAEVVDVGHGDSNDRMPGLLERRDFRFLILRRRRFPAADRRNTRSLP